MTTHLLFLTLCALLLFLLSLFLLAFSEPPSIALQTVYMNVLLSDLGFQFRFCSLEGGELAFE